MYEGSRHEEIHDLIVAATPCLPSTVASVQAWFDFGNRMLEEVGPFTAPRGGVEYVTAERDQ